MAVLFKVNKLFIKNNFVNLKININKTVKQLSIFSKKRK